MLSKPPRAPFPGSDAPDLPGAADAPATLDAPADLVQRYVELAARRRELESELSYVRAELELLALSGLSEATPRGRFVAPGGRQVVARLQPTCVFDRQEVSRALQREGRLADVATVTGPSLARFLAQEPALSARLGDMVRHRRGIVLMATGG